ncbi:SixA phosphatase family protein [Nocardioides jiangxiensis]|uniref:Histidine phosphatase family protein n=1 Tax=Nocardioides jiangxiensis TaxID=3064524 RepID=A0ABT9B5E1_9ACTN|nr:histidine phosphatase family protein [Nocardioides sp. WY-20]MDO7869610.1 histidine phosphatase family protein [Nocardioides sp. WY-20]
MTRTLVLIRHAEAESWAPSDVERALTPAGTEMAGALGRWLRGRGVVPDTALVSGALRTRQTWAALSAEAGWQLAPTHDDGLYTAGPDTALDLVRYADPDAATLLVLGHNPTVHFLAQVLSDGTGDPALTESLTIGFPPASVAVLEFDVEWARVSEGYGRLTAVRPGC